MRRTLLLACGVAILGCGGSPLKLGGKDGGGGADGGTGGLAGGSSDAAPGADGAIDVAADTSERDATDAALDEAEAGPSFDIAPLPGLVLWLDAAKGITLDPGRPGVVRGWADQSLKGNDFIVPAVESGVLLVSGAVGGLPAVQLGLVPKMITSDKGRAAALPSGTGDYLIEVVAKWRSTSPAIGDDIDLFQSGVIGDGPSCFVGSLDGRVFSGLRDGANPDTIPDAGSTEATFNDGAFRVVGGRRSATSLEVRVNGAVEGILIDPTVGTVITVPNYGQLGAGSGLSIAEVVVIVGPTSEADTERLEAHLVEKYGLH